MILSEPGCKTMKLLLKYSILFAFVFFPVMFISELLKIPRDGVVIIIPFIVGYLIISILSDEIKKNEARNNRRKT